jgi:hypothetical protein
MTRGGKRLDDGLVASLITRSDRRRRRRMSIQCPLWMRLSARGEHGHRLGALSTPGDLLQSIGFLRKDR